MEPLTPSELNSPLWAKIERNVTELRDRARRQLENNLPLDETNRVRGRIIGLRDVLQFGKEFSPLD